MIRYILALILTLNCCILYAKPPVYVRNLLDAIALSEEINADVLVMFTASWCGACQVMKHDINTDTSGLLDDHIICYVNHDTEVDLVKEYRVKFLPDYFLLRKRKEIKRKTGYKNWKEFKQWLRADE